MIIADDFLSTQLAARYSATVTMYFHIARPQPILPEFWYGRPPIQLNLADNSQHRRFRALPWLSTMLEAQKDDR